MSLEERIRVLWLERRLATVLLDYHSFVQYEGGSADSMPEFAKKHGVNDEVVIKLAVRGQFKESDTDSPWGDTYDTDKCKLCDEYSAVNEEGLCIWGCSLEPIGERPV